MTGRIGGTGLLLALATAGSLRAQERAPAMALDRTFAGGAADSAFVQLERGRVYRAELIGPQATLEIVHTGRRREPALVVDIPSRSIPGRAVFEVYARERGIHVVRVTGLGAAEAVQLRLDADSAGRVEQALRQEDRLSRKWTLGIRVGAGAQGRFELTPTAEAGGGSSLDGALRFSSATFPVSLALGAISQRAADGATSVLWFYGEPQVRLLGTAHLDLALLGVFAVGNAERMTIDPTLYGGGLQVLYNLRADPARRGAALHARYVLGTIGGTGMDPETSQLVVAGLAWTF